VVGTELRELVYVSFFSYEPMDLSRKKKTLAATLEDLSNNIGMSLLSSDLTYVSLMFQYISRFKNNSLTDTRRMNSTIADVIIAVMFGVAALDENALLNTRNLLAVVETTRCPDLATVLNNCGPRVMPLNKRGAKTRFRFRVLNEIGEGDTHQVGFKLEQDVMSGELKPYALLMI
jgi:cell division protein FtsB